MALLLSWPAASAQAGEAPPRRSIRGPAGAYRSSNASNPISVPTTPSSTLRWRPRTPARSVSIEGPQSFKRTQLLDRLEDEPAASPAAPSGESGPSLNPGVRGVLQPDTGVNQPRPGLPGQTELDRALAFGPDTRLEPCPSPKDLKRIVLVDTDITPPGLPTDAFPQYCPLGDEAFQPRCWEPLTYTWKASALCHKPLYFEERGLERYGHTIGHFTPLLSGVHFFGTLPILPYKMGMEMPWECMYSLGYYEPGNCAPYIIPPVPLNLRGALLEAGAWTGGVFLIP